MFEWSSHRVNEREDKGGLIITSVRYAIYNRELMPKDNVYRTEDIPVSFQAHPS